MHYSPWVLRKEVCAGALPEGPASRWLVRMMRSVRNAGPGVTGPVHRPCRTSGRVRGRAPLAALTDLLLAAPLLSSAVCLRRPGGGIL